MDRSRSASDRPGRTRRIVLFAVVCGAFLLAVPFVRSPADVQRLLGRTTTVEATVVEMNTVRAQTSGFPRWIEQRFTVTWADPDGAARTGTSAVITRDGAGLDLSQTVSAQWIPGGDDVTVATVGQSVVAVGWPLAGGLLLLMVGLGLTVGWRWLRGRRPAGGRDA